MRFFDIEKNRVLHIFFCIVFLLVSSKANQYVSSIITLFVFLVVILVYVYKNNLFYTKPIQYLIVFITAYAIGIYSVFYTFPALAAIVRYSSYILLAYCFSRYKIKDFMMLYDKVLFVFVVIGLVFFVLELLYKTNFTAFVGNISNALNIHLGEYSERRELGYYNIFIYTTNYADGTARLLERRNSGFTMEPGLFSVLVSFGLLFSLINNKFNLNKKQVMYVVAILTTQSTGGFIYIMLIVTFYVVNNSKKRMLALIPVSAVIIYFLWISPVTRYRVEYLYEQSQLIDVQRMEEGAQISGLPRSLGRFYSVTYAMDLIGNHSPYLGFFGVENGARSQLLHMPSSIAMTLYYFGYVGFFFVIIGVVKTFSKISHLISNQNRLINSALMTILFFACMASFPFTNTLFFWFFILWGFYR